MCDYSLELLQSRPAKVGEKLTTRRFNATSGFAAAEDINMAVCVLPGTELAFTSPIKCRRAMWWGGWKPMNLSHTTAIFRQIDKHNAYVHHDALEFPDGRMVLLNNLVEDQEATVLQLPVQAVTVEAKNQQRVHYIG